MTRCSAGALALASLVSACAPERTQPTEPVVASAATAHLTSPAPLMEQTLYDIVDETGVSIWRPFLGDSGYELAPTPASFTLAINGSPCERFGFEGGWEIVTCGRFPAPGFRSTPRNPPLLDECRFQSPPLPFAMVTNDQTCWELIPTEGSVGEYRIDLEAAQAAPGVRLFRRWEVLGGDGTLLPCSQGQSSLQCRVITRGAPDQTPEGQLRIFIRLHYEPSGWVFSGFFAPVDNLPTVNTMRAGRAVPIKFRLGGDQGLNVLAARSPSSVRVDCDFGYELDAIEETLTAGASSLSYDAASDTYTYVWKTERSWAGTCRDFTLALADGSAPKTVRFKF